MIVHLSDIVEVLGEDQNGWTWSKKKGTELIGYVPTQALGPFPAPQHAEPIETPFSLDLDHVNAYPNVVDEVKSFFSQFGEVYYFDSRPPNGPFPTYRFALDILSTVDFETIKSAIVNQPFYNQNAQLTPGRFESNPLELFLSRLPPSFTKSEVLELIHPANPTKVSVFFPKEKKTFKNCAIVFPDARSANAAFRDRSRWISKQPDLTVKFQIRSSPTRASCSPPPVQVHSTSVYLTNLPNGVIPSDIVNTLFPTSIITHLHIHTAPPDRTVSAVVHFKTESEAQQAISQSGSLFLLSNRINVREDRVGGERFSRSSVSPVSVSPPPLPQNLPPHPTNSPFQPQPPPRRYPQSPPPPPPPNQF
ncbi:hypothetical protein BLNAU_9993 [Blattamonas nauphoetae]|uniref:RRM domain-containing protein n=1 Tax=Blattamonas nauphoetae TaxID=2049346 RepID=A0ABQ9XUA7_9EUKA|nr:hypothetical protein BLNAU_9993 [Blattamonas nauphoetae]